MRKGNNTGKSDRSNRSDSQRLIPDKKKRRKFTKKPSRQFHKETKVEKARPNHASVITKTLRMYIIHT